MTDGDQLTTLRELLRDALEIARSAGVAAQDPDATEVFDRSREAIAAILGPLDDLATRRSRSA